MFSRFFIQHPVLANTIALVTLLIGIVAVLQLPVAQYPNVVPPTVQVTARFPGSSAKAVMETVGLPIERQVNGVQGMLYMQSTSASDGSYNLTVTFDIGTDPDQAQILVQNRVAAAQAQLPAAVQTQGVNVRKRSTSILAFAALNSADDRYDSLFLSNYAKINMVDSLARVPGVGDVTIFGAGDYAMRVWLDPDRLQSLGLTPADVSRAIESQSQTASGGQIGQPPVASGQGFQTVLDIQGRLSELTEFENIAVKTDPDTQAVVRLGDVARIELGSKSYGQVFRLNGRPSAAIAISQLPEANALEVYAAVEAEIDRLAQDFPEGLSYSIPFNTTEFVDASVHTVYKTLIEACLIVLGVILLFLQDWRAMLVPATTVPVTLVGAFAAMAAMGFTINMSTLFALVLAIGIVVDDAIVIVEGTARHLEDGLDGPAAAETAMGELFGPIIGITLVLIAVFLPAAFLPGLTGQLYQQFALVIAATALISAVNAVTLKPVQAALWMRPIKPVAQRNIVYRLFERGFTRLENGYAWLLGRLLRWRWVVTGAALLLVALAFAGLSRVPAGFLPPEDQGYFVVTAQLPPGASLERSDTTLREIQTRLQDIPEVENVITVAGVSLMDANAPVSHAGMAYVVLKPWDERKERGFLETYQALSGALHGLSDGTATVLPPPPIQGIGNTGGFTMAVELTDGSADFARLTAAARQITTRALEDPRIQMAQVNANTETPQMSVQIDRTKAANFGVATDDIFGALSGYLGASYVNQFTRFGQTFQVYLQADGDYRDRIAEIARLRVPNAAGNQVPLGSLITMSEAVGPSLISLYNLHPAVTISGRGAADIGSGEAMAIMEQIAAETLPPGMATEWTAMSYQEEVAGGQIYIAFGLALLLVYFVLAAQYESWLGPVPVILSVPLALAGTVAVMLPLGLQNTLYTQIGLILLIALAAKNAILIVEFARDLRIRQGAGLMDAALTAGRLRFRPILMTSLAFILGMVPLVLATGAGANASRSIGISVVSGMAISTVLSIFVVPAMFLIVRVIEERLAAPRNRAASAG
ncbi:efflux RND transporter permease subunit [Paracoccus laeviglucosivorans]|uniref:Efflux pump membrane transporter n=1 Tax=Paracoccus laeviglucosivorans TaxID=1197861 RepID=A0A521FCY9_9RHOB|nr:efflux RND transporter permease subunit [Paracoccus laeviglucosivorans]SMO93894.1 hydrophobic/amphiphilic exporter-1, HAE1 family [Paracoccus laeviglucosivorans]